MKLKDACSLEVKLWQTQSIKKQRHHFADKSPCSQSIGFSSSHVWMWELDHKEGWTPTNWCFWIVVLEKILESPLNRKEVKPVNPKGNQLWIFTRSTDAKPEAPIASATGVIWPPETKNWPAGKDSDAGKEWRQKEEGAAEDEMVRQHHWLNGHESEQTPGDMKDKEAWHAAIHGVSKSQTQCLKNNSNPK